MKIKSKAIIFDKLLKLAESPANDGVRLAFLEGDGMEELKSLDLSALTEFKRSSNGTVELKFVDRLAALKWLAEQGEDTRAEQLYQALEKGRETMEE